MDAQDKPGDALPMGQPSQTQVEPSTPPKTYKEDEVEQIVRTRHSTLDKRIAVLEKSQTAAEKRAADAESALAQFQREREEAELEAAKGDPDKTSILQRQRKVKEEETRVRQERETLERERQEHAAEVEAARQTRREIDIWNISTKHNVDANKLKEKAEKYKLDSLEDIEDLAKDMPKIPETEIKPDSNISSGGGKDFSKMSPDEKLQEGFKRIKK